jgi:hypothetical protein
MGKRQGKLYLVKTLCVLVSLIYLSSIDVCFAKSHTYEQTWVLRQSSNFAGTVSSDLTDNALKMHIGRLGLTIITKAPNWNALVFNENSKTYVDLPYKTWQKKLMFSSKGNYRDTTGKSALKLRNTGKIMNIDKFSTYECLVIKKADPAKKIAEETITQLWIASDIKAPPQIAQIFCGHLGIPMQKGIPLKANRCVNGKMISALETLSVKREKLPASIFEPFQGYRKVKDEFELVMGESSDKAMEDLLDVPTKTDVK